ncbi:hypothetical protein FGADI_7577 [Fusarium gaditjirri]|uniref:CBM-cenC domain-containing protein n=1 Tax=Fusarium gaditjirri TaxID=282569 RepID=A0A8H4WVI1_9HYPO|nr:hypothetical protein FGADI_7577 [Fusarium gaditjirri]
MKSLRGIAIGLVALLTADIVVAGPCKPSSILTTTETSVSTESSVTTRVDVSVTTESLSSTSVTSLETSSETETSVLSTTVAASSIETSASSIISSSVTSTELLSTAETTTADKTTEAISTTTTTEAAATLPTIANAGFDDNNTGSPWTSTGQVSNGAVFWKHSDPNIMLIRPGRFIAQQIDGLRTNLSYRIRFYWVKFDTPSATAGCQLSVTFGGQDLGVVALLPPRTPNNAFEEYVSTVYQPSSSSEELMIRMDCTAAGQTNRFYVDDVSIEFA